MLAWPPVYQSPPELLLNEKGEVVFEVLVLCKAPSEDVGCGELA